MSKEIQIFKNEEFGQVRALEINGEPYFVGKDVAEVLGYVKPQNAIATHVDEDDTLKQGIIDNLGRTQQTTVINESGLYSLILSSKLPQAKKFKRWVTSEVLPQIRKTGSYQIPKMSKELEAILMIDGKQQKMDERITKLENNTTIDYSQQEDLRELANKKIVAILGGTDAPAYRELNKKVFSNFWRDYKRKLNVNSYKNTLVKDYDIGRQAIINWNPSKEVKFMIDGCNAQIRM
ncbi:BRO family protein [Clostridium butyricum]|uniref:BRO family protein n=1 Tax=Clostridium butyricum TaxID=1492 RepID=UPI00051C3353|nr:BRO family protein [Clostridium butyricum]QUF81988.1 ORF6C domain-containing protein [Clostridium butyricum]